MATELPSFEHLIGALTAGEEQPSRLVSSVSRIEEESDDAPIPVSSPSTDSFKLRDLPFPIRLEREVTPGNLDRSQHSLFGVLIRSDRASPAIPNRGRMAGGAPESDFECDRCGAKRTPEKRLGPNGRRTLCNRCGLAWRREEKLKRAGKETQDQKITKKRTATTMTDKPIM